NPSCSGCRAPFCSSPSTVMISLPRAWTAKTVHDLTGRPSISTVHAPQCVVSQPMCVPVKRSTSRIKCTSSRRGSTSASCFSPLIESATCMASPPGAGALDGSPDRAHREHAHHVLLVLDRPAQVRGGLGRVGSQLRGPADRGLVRQFPRQRDF